MGLNKRLLKFARENRDKPQLTCGIVRGFLNGNLVLDYTGNLTVGVGREFVAGRLFDFEDYKIEGVASGTDIKNHSISHWGFGSGGTTMSEGFINLTGPSPCDNDLYEPIEMDNRDENLDSPTLGIENVLKPILNENKSVIQTADIEDCTIYSYVKIIIGIQPNEPSYLGSDEVLKIDEAALFSTNYQYLSTLPGFDYDDVVARQFAHLCFKPKYIEKDSEFYLEWVILC